MKNSQRGRLTSVLAVFLAFCMFASSMPLPVYAQQVSETEQTIEQIGTKSEEAGQTDEPADNVTGEPADGVTDESGEGTDSPDTQTEKAEENQQTVDPDASVDQAEGAEKEDTFVPVSAEEAKETAVVVEQDKLALDGSKSYVIFTTCLQGDHFYGISPEDAAAEGLSVTLEGEVYLAEEGRGWTLKQAEEGLYIENNGHYLTVSEDKGSLVISEEVTVSNLTIGEDRTFVLAEDPVKYVSLEYDENWEFRAGEPFLLTEAKEDAAIFFYAEIQEEETSEQQSEDPSQNPEEPENPSEQPGAGEPAPAALTQYELTVYFKEGNTNLPADQGGVDVGYFGRYHIESVGSGSETITGNGSVTLSLEEGKINVLTAYASPDYKPDMGGTFKAMGGTEFWVYASADGPKLVTADTFDALMEDAAFSAQMNELLQNNYDLEKIVNKYGEWGESYNDPEYRPRLLKRHLSTFPDLTVNMDGAYSVTLEYAKRDVQPLEIVATDANDNLLPDIAYSFYTSDDRYDSNGVTEGNGVVLGAEDSKNIPLGLWMVEVDGCEKSPDKSYIRKYAKTDKVMTPASTYALIIYVGPDSIELVTPDNFVELNKDPQFQAAAMEWKIGGFHGILKAFVMDYTGVSNENGTVKLPFTKWTSPTIKFRAVDQDNNIDPLPGIQYYCDALMTAAGETKEITFTEPGLYKVTAGREDHTYMAAIEAFRYNGENREKGGYDISLWVTADGTVEVVDDARLEELCEDEVFLNQVGGYEYLYGIKPDYEYLKEMLRIDASYTLPKDSDTYLLPFTKLASGNGMILTETKDKAISYGKYLDSSQPKETIKIFYACPEDGTYYIGLGVSSYDGNNHLTVIDTKGNKIITNMKAGYNVKTAGATVELKKNVLYILTVNRRAYDNACYYCVYVEKKPTIDKKVDLHTADYIKFNDTKYSNLTALSCGEEMEHRILARYPGEKVDAGSWVFNVAMPTGADYTEGSLKVQYLPDSEGYFTGSDDGENPFDAFKDLSDGFETLEVEKIAFTEAATFNDKNIYSLTLAENQGIQVGDLMMVTYTSTVNTTAWYGAIYDMNMSWGYWSVLDDKGAVVESYDKVNVRVDYEEPVGAFADPAFCQVFGIKIYKYSNYDRLMAPYKGAFDEAVLMQEHLLGGAEFQIDGENLSKIIVIRDDKVELGDKPEAERPAMMSVGRGAEGASGTAGGGAALAQRMDEETVLKLLYYRYEQGLQDLSDISVAQTQTYYALNEDNLYTRTAPTSETMEFYADNGQGYRLKPSMFSAEAGDTVRVGDGGGLLLGGLGAGEYTLTETKAPEGYALIEPIHINIRWMKQVGENKYEPLGDNEVPDYNSPEYCMVCEIDGVPVSSTVTEEGVWHPSSSVGGFGSYESIWNPLCYVLVDPIGDDRISFASVKEVNDPADKKEAFTLKFQITDPEGKLYTKVNYAVGREDGQYVTAKNELTADAEGWFQYSFNPGEKIAFVNLREGSTYKVMEDDGRTSQYVVTYENEEGTIAYDESNTYPMAVVTNNKGMLTIRKAVTGSGDKNKSFSFKVDLTDAEGKKLEKVSYVKGETQGTINIANEVIGLKDGESVTLYVPIGTRYKVTELEADKDGYTTTVQNSEGIISKEEPVQEAAFTNDKKEEPPKPTEPKPTEPKPTEPEPTKPERPNRKWPSFLPRTGDDFPLGAWIAVAVISVIGLITLIFVKKKK